MFLVGNRSSGLGLKRESKGRERRREGVGKGL